jgi:hypothetical protein
MDKVCWKWLSCNSNAMHILEKNVEKVNWELMCSNTILFEYDYRTMKANTAIFKEELVAKAFHPSRVVKWIEEGVDPSEM